MRTWTQNPTLFALPVLVSSFLILNFASPNGCGNCWAGENLLLLVTSFGLIITGMILFERGMPKISWRWRTPLRWVWYLVAIPWLLLIGSFFVFFF